MADGAVFAFVSIVVLTLIPQAMFLYAETFAPEDLQAEGLIRPDSSDIFNVFPTQENSINDSGDCRIYVQAPGRTAIGRYVWYNSSSSECQSLAADDTEEGGFFEFWGTISEKWKDFREFMEMLIDIFIGVPASYIRDFVTSFRLATNVFNIPIYIMVAFYAPFIFMLVTFIAQIASGFIPK